METLTERATRLGIGTATVTEMLDEIERLRGEVEGADVLHDAEKMLHSRTKAMMGDLAKLVTRLARQLGKAAPDNELPALAMDYLHRNDMNGTPLRAVCVVNTGVTRAMLTAAHGVTLERGDVVLSARLLERIYLAMTQAALTPNARNNRLPEGSPVD